MVATVVPNVVNSEIAGFIHVLSSELVDRGYVFSLYVTNDRVKTEARIITELVKSDLAGVLKFPTTVTYGRNVRKRLREAGIPCVVINDFWTPCYEDHHVAYDERAAVEMAVQHLAELGHRRIGLLDSEISPRVRAINAYRDALRQQGLTCDERLLLLGIPSDAPALGRAYGEGGVKPTALITMYNVMAEKVTAGLAQRGIRVPEDVSMVNINGPSVSEPAAPRAGRRTLNWSRLVM